VAQLAEMLITDVGCLALLAANLSASNPASSTLTTSIAVADAFALMNQGMSLSDLLRVYLNGASSVDGSLDKPLGDNGDVMVWLSRLLLAVGRVDLLIDEVPSESSSPALQNGRRLLLNEQHCPRAMLSVSSARAQMLQLRYVQARARLAKLLQTSDDLDSDSNTDSIESAAFEIQRMLLDASALFELPMGDDNSDIDVGSVDGLEWMLGDANLDDDLRAHTARFTPLARYFLHVMDVLGYPADGSRFPASPCIDVAQQVALALDVSPSDLILASVQHADDDEAMAPARAALSALRAHVRRYGFQHALRTPDVRVAFGFIAALVTREDAQAAIDPEFAQSQVSDFIAMLVERCLVAVSEPSSSSAMTAAAVQVLITLPWSSLGLEDTVVSALTDFLKSAATSPDVDARSDLGSHAFKALAAFWAVRLHFSQGELPSFQQKKILHLSDGHDHEIYFV
jgi:hypothetical protein